MLALHRLPGTSLYPNPCCPCRSSAVFLPHTPGVVNDIEAQVRNGFMQGNAAAGAPVAPTMQR